jgi:hypothetical protein
MTDVERLAAAVAELAAEQAVLAGLVRQLAEREAPQRWMRTGAMCKLAGIHRSTLYSWERLGLVGRGADAIGEVVWDREEVLRVTAARPKPKRRQKGR